MSNKNIAVILSGCGYLDGAEIHEATLTLLAINQHGSEYSCFAPDKDQHHVVDHISGEESTEKRNVLVESARIARGSITDLAQFDASRFDALILPGGFGAAKNLSDLAFKGPECTIDEQLAAAVTSMREAGKPIGALCISPAVIAKLVPGTNLTIGQDAGTAEAVVAMGCSHTATMHGEIVIDEANKVVSTPCYMLDSRIDQIYEGANKLVKAVLDMT